MVDDCKSRDIGKATHFRDVICQVHKWSDPGSEVTTQILQN